MAINKILVIRFRRVGDAVISSTLCTSLKKSFPNAEIHYVLNEAICPLFAEHPYIDKLISFSDEENNKLSHYITKVKQVVREHHYDIIVDTRSTIRTLLFSFFSLKTPYRIGTYKKYNALLQNMRTDTDFDGTNDIVQSTLWLLDPLAKKFAITKDPVFKLYCTDQEKKTFSIYMADQGVDLGKPLIVCAVTARLEYKIWAKTKMKEVLTRILDKYPDAQLIFNYGGKKEKEFAEKLYTEMNSHKRIFINIEAKNLRELIALFANTNFFFGNEGGPRHISQAMDVPSFAIYPPNVDKTNWLPNISERFAGIELADINPTKAIDKQLSYEDKLALIDVESVWKGLDTMLDRYLKK